MKKILAIGNSFSQDATALLQLLTDDLFVRNLYIGGCSLERHCNNIKSDERAYSYEENGAPLRREPISVKEALLSDKWDYVTLQQVSGLSGIEESFYPYLSELISYIRKYSSAEIVLHRTWAYEVDSTHGAFERYGSSQKKMHEAIVRTYDNVSKKENLKIIDVGSAIADLRTLPEFDYGNGGLSLCRDGFHLSFNYGRFVAAAVWCKFFTGKYPEIKETSPAFGAIKRYFKENE